MEILERYQPKRDQYWPEVERFFGRLSPRLYQQGLVLKSVLATHCAEAGELKSVLCRKGDYPLLTFHFWLLDDLGVPDGEARAELERHLLLAMFFSFAAAYAHEAILDRDTLIDERYHVLREELSCRASRHLARLFPEDSPFWEHCESIWHERAEALLWEAHERAGQPAPFTEDDLWHAAGKLSPGKLPVVAVALRTGNAEALPRLLDMVAHLNLALQLRRDLLSVRRDLARGTLTYPIVRTMIEAGIPLKAGVVPERILGAMLLTGSLKKICKEILGHLDTCRGIARELNLPSWAEYFGGLEQAGNDLSSLLSLAPGASPPADRPKPSFLPAPNTLEKSIRMAEAHLLSDLTFRESWDIQRLTLFDIPEVVGRAFPTGLILEILCANGHELAPQVDELFRTLCANGFRYFENFDIPPDADEVGLLLRLHRLSGRKEAHREALEKPLEWLLKSISPSGGIPVYLVAGSGIAGNQEASLWGTDCMTVAANCLLGLLDYDWERFRTVIEKSAADLFARLCQEGLGFNNAYDLPYALWTASGLVSKLSGLPIDDRLCGELGRATPVLNGTLRQEAAWRSITPQRAAFLTLSSLMDSSELPFEERWINVLLKSQRYDGTWVDEPLYPTPNRNATVTWYSSRSVTTAFCYHALQTFQRFR